MEVINYHEDPDRVITIEWTGPGGTQYVVQRAPVTIKLKPEATLVKLLEAKFGDEPRPHVTAERVLTAAMPSPLVQIVAGTGWVITVLVHPHYSANLSPSSLENRIVAVVETAIRAVTKARKTPS